MSCSQPGAGLGGLGDPDVRSDRGSAAVAHRGPGLLLQEDLGRTRGARGEEGSEGSGRVRLTTVHFGLVCCFSCFVDLFCFFRLLQMKDNTA